jgi:hypothetical protein
MSQTNFSAAIEKAQAKRDVASRLSKLPPDAQRDVLADLLLALDERTVEFRPRVVIQGLGEDRPKRKGVRRAGRPRGSVRGGSRADALYESLKAHPRMPISDLAAKHYPGDADGKHKVRAVLWSLKTQKRAHNPEPGQWEALP